MLPVPLAAGLYGVLLGLGFTTFVLSFAVYGLAAACLALGEPTVGLVVGLAFATGRIVPVVVLAPLQETARGIDVAAAMAERPRVLRTIRAVGALALSAAALARRARRRPGERRRAREPADRQRHGPERGRRIGGLAGAGDRDRRARPRGRPGPQALPGADPALGPDSVVWRDGETLVVADPVTLAERRRVDAPGVEEPAVSGRWLVWRAREAGGDVLRVLDLSAPDSPPADIRRAARARPARAPVARRRPRRLPPRAAQRQQHDRGDLPADAAAHDAALRPQRRPAAQPLRARRARCCTSARPPSASACGSARAARARGDRDRTLYSTYPTVRRDAGHERDHERHGAGYPGGKAPKFPERAPEGVQVTLWSTALAPGRAAYVSRLGAPPQGTANTILRLAR